MKYLLLILTLFCGTWVLAQEDDDELQIITFDEGEDAEDVDVYYYDWDMAKYSIGLNMNSLLAFRPAITVTHDIGLDDYTRVAIETSYIPGLFELQQKGFKLRATYQKFLYKDENFGFYVGGGANLVSFWQPRVDQVYLEDAYWRTYKEVSNQTLFSGVGECGFTIDFSNSFLVELTLGLGAGYHRVGGSYVIIDDFRWEPLFGGRTDPGNYWAYPSYCNLSFSIPVISMFERE